MGMVVTYSGHPVAAAVALETLDIYEELNLVKMVQAIAPALQSGILGFSDHSLIGDTDGVGLLAVAELVANKETGDSFPADKRVGPYLLDRALDHGLIVRALGDRIAFSPPLVISHSEIEEMFKRFGKALNDTTKWLESGQ